MADEAPGDEGDEGDESAASSTEPTTRRFDGETDRTWQPSNRPISSDADADGDPDDRSRIRLDLAREDDREDRESDAQRADDSDDEYGPEPSSAPIEAGDPRLENVVFVLLGAIAMILVIVRIVAIPM